MTVVYSILLVGVLIFVHELGHFVWAKLLGVRVLKFSLGFGPRLAGFTLGETDYQIAVIPLGGYVQMLGEGNDDPIPEAEVVRSFGAQPLWKRVIIVVAGPVMNLLFPLVLFFVFYLGDGQLAPPVVGTVFPNRPAEGRLLTGDHILAIDDDEVSTFYEVQARIRESPGQVLSLRVLRGEQEVEVVLTPVLTRQVHELGREEIVGRVGINPLQPVPVVGVLSPFSPAWAAGLRTFDVVVSVAGQPVERWLDLERALARQERTLLPLTYLRPVRYERALGGLVDIEVYEPHVATLAPEPGPGPASLRAGLEPGDLYIRSVGVDSPEHLAGLLPGDRLVTLDGRPVRMWVTFLKDLELGEGRTHEVVVRRGDELLEATYGLHHERGVTAQGQVFDRYVASVENWAPLRAEPPVDNPARLTYAFDKAVTHTREMIELTVLSVVRLFQGRLSVKTIGGPIAIFEAAGSAAREGSFNYLSLMAFFSVNLGLINLLPIPILDGGHLLIFLVEAVRRKRLGKRARGYAALAGLLLLVILLVIATKNDLERMTSGGETTAVEIDR